LTEQAQRWQCLGPVAPGGTVFGVAISPLESVSAYWAATGCGVFISRDDGQSWAQSLRGLSTPLLSAISVAPNGALFAGALGGDLFVSLDFGLSWKAGLVPQEYRATVTALLASPNFAQDGVAFAATDGGGLLATRNSGNSWEDSSFGMDDTTVLAVAATPDWSRNEVMFAATLDGVYISRNGGRAWRETELMGNDEVIDVIAVSPAFEQDRTVFAGTEDGRLYRSQDGGRSWDVVQDKLSESPVNCLWLAPDFAESQRLVAGVGTEVIILNDGGESRQGAMQMPSIVLTLSGNEQVLLAGVHDAGIYRSVDHGETWASLSGNLAARGFAMLSPVAGGLYAMGPQEGLWFQGGDGAPWHHLPGLSSYLPLSAQCVTAPGCLLVASSERGILRSVDGGERWDLVHEGSGIQALALLEETGLGWAGATDGRLLVTQDGGLSWQDAGAPADRQAILSLAVSPTFGRDRTLLMGTSIPATANAPARVALWRSRDGGSSWQLLTTQATDARWMDISMPLGVEEDVASQAVLATGAFCLRPLRRAKDVWISTRVDPKGANILSVVVLGEIDNGAMLFAATGNGVYRSIDSGRTWQLFSEGLAADSFISIAAVDSGQPKTLYALSLGGLVWKYTLE
jgi:photosystem II stability/assembly factor-like uncharacterized protein